MAGVTYFGRYELRGLVGSGGMGEVYEAFDREQNRLVALKLLPAALAADEGFVERFRRESFAAAQLNDPHVIPIHRYGDIDGRLYIDMRLVKGLDLAGVLARDGALSAARAVSFMSQAAEALDAAHAANLIHRDIKPSNLLVTPGDFVYLVDFGIAHVFGLGTTGKALTATGATIGTLDYMAPERFIGRTEVDSRTDVYSLTCVLYECLTANRPFPVEGLPALLHAHLNTPPPRASAERDDLPAALDAVLARGMAKNPDDRYASAGEMAQAAAAAIRGRVPAGLATSAPPPTTPTTAPGSTPPSRTDSTAPPFAPAFATAVGSHPKSGDQPRVGAVPSMPPAPTYVPSNAIPAAFSLVPPPSASGNPGTASAPSAFPTAGPATAVEVPAARKRRAGWLIGAAALVVTALIGGVLVGRIAFGSSTAAPSIETGVATAAATSQPSSQPTSVSTPAPTQPSETVAAPVQTVVVTSTVAQTVVSTPPPVTVAPTFAPTPGGGSGDLGVSAPIANLGCTGQYAAFVGSAVDPGSYQAEVQHLLSSFPGSSYLMTESSCAALVPTVNGNSVYAVYLGPFSNPSQACAAANRAGGGTYVKALSNTSPDAATVEC